MNGIISNGLRALIIGGYNMADKQQTAKVDDLIEGWIENGEIDEYGVILIRKALSEQQKQHEAEIASARSEVYDEMNKQLNENDKKHEAKLKEIREMILSFDWNEDVCISSELTRFLEEFDKLVGK